MCVCVCAFQFFMTFFYNLNIFALFYEWGNLYMGVHISICMCMYGFVCVKALWLQFTGALFSAYIHFDVFSIIL